MEFKTDWYDSDRLPEEVGTKVVELSGLDYLQFKLFHLSILWRCSVAKIPEFDTVNLGPHESRIAKIIQEETMLPEKSYRFFGRVLVHDDDSVVQDLVTRPQASKFEGHHVYYACYGGCEWTFFVSSHSSVKHKDMCLREDGSMMLLRTPLRESNTMRLIAQQRASGPQ